MTEATGETVNITQSSQPSAPSASSASSAVPSFFGHLTGPLVMLAALVFYLLTVCPTVVWVDGARLATLMYRLDLRGEAQSHPLYILAGWLFMRLPVGDPGYRANLVSVAMGVAIVGLGYDIARRLTGDRAAAALGALALMVTHYVWFHAVIAEDVLVVPLVLLLLIWLVVRWRETRCFRWAALAAFAFGAGLTAHLEAGLIVPGLLAAGLPWVYRHRRWLPQAGPTALLARAAALAGLALLGFLPYLVLWLGAAGRTGLGAGLGAQFLPALAYGVTRAPATLLALMVSWPFQQFGCFIGLGGLVWLLRARRWNGVWTLILVSQLCVFTFALFDAVPDQYEVFTGAYALFGIFVAAGLHALRAETSPPDPLSTAVERGNTRQGSLVVGASRGTHVRGSGDSPSPAIRLLTANSRRFVFPLSTAVERGSGGEVPGGARSGVPWRRRWLTLALILLLVPAPVVFDHFVPIVVRAAGGTDTDLGLVVLPGRDGLRWYLDPNKRGDHSAAQWEDAMLAWLPPRAVVVMNRGESYDMGLVLEYALGVQGRRPDVTLLGPLADGTPGFPALLSTGTAQQRGRTLGALLAGQGAGRPAFFLSPPGAGTPALPELVIALPPGYRAVPVVTVGAGVIYQLESVSQ